jgi:cysteine desulfurase
MLVNNETGGMTDIAAVSRVLREARSGALLHTDAVQAFLKTPFSPASLGADLLSVSGHKIHAPKGTGALYIRKGLRLPPLLVGGGQEDGLRSGTEALPSVAAFGAAARIGRELMAETPVRIDRLRRSAVERLTHAVPGIVFIGGGSGHILSLSLPGYRSEVLMNYLESKGIYVAKSSACKRGARSHVLEAMGLGPSVIDGALRISLSRYTTQEEIDLFCSALQSARKELLPSLS